MVTVALLFFSVVFNYTHLSLFSVSFLRHIYETMSAVSYSSGSYSNLNEKDKKFIIVAAYFFSSYFFLLHVSSIVDLQHSSCTLCNFCLLIHFCGYCCCCCCSLCILYIGVAVVGDAVDSKLFGRSIGRGSSC